MISSIEEFLLELKKEMAGYDRAIIQDASSDAEEYLRDALEFVRLKHPGIPDTEALQPIIEVYGTPGEIAAAYKRIAPRTYSSAEPSRRERSPVSRIFGITGDSKAWGSLIYMLFSLATGIIYFTWAVTGLSLSLGLLVLIIGIPIAGLFLFSVRGLSLLEGRMVEALLGVRMPHRSVFSNRKLGLWGRFKELLGDRYTWLSVCYLIIMLPLGIFYFSLFVALLASALWLGLRPIVEMGFNLPVYQVGDVGYFTPGWAMPFSVAGGIVIFLGTMHLAKVMGKLQGALAKAMLVRQ